MNEVKIEVKFKKDLYPYRAGDVGMMKESFARGQFADDVEIIGDKPAKNEKKPSNSSVTTSDDTTQGEEEKSVVESPENKSMSDRKTKNSK